MKHSIVLNDRVYPYQVNRSKRARYLRVKLSPDGEITLVLPQGVSLSTGEQFLYSKSAWLTHHLQALPEPKTFAETRPESLDLNFIDEQWHVNYEAGEAGFTIVEESSNKRLIVRGNITDKDLVTKALGEWLKYKAKAVLPKRLAYLAEQHGFHFNKVSIRGQKTRWGSCSSQKNINLNYKLLFLDKPLTDYVLIHELCHTIEMNHSSRFWALVADCDANYKAHDQQVNEATKTIPI